MSENKDQKGRIMKYEHFDLLNFKVSSDGVDARYYNLMHRDVLQKPSSRIIPHPDLQEQMDQLKQYFSKKIGLLEGWEFARDNIKDPETLKIAVDGYNNTIERCKITGLSFTGENEGKGVSIIGYEKFPQKGGSGISSGKILFESDKLGYETEVMETCEAIKKEVYAYLFQGKKAQQDLISQSE